MIRLLLLYAIAWYSGHTGLAEAMRITSGSCRRCYWNRHLACTVTMYGSSNVYQKGVRMFPDGHTVTDFDVLSDQLQYCTQESGQLQYPFTTRTAQVKTAWADVFGGNSFETGVRISNDPITDFYNGTDFPLGAVLFTQTRRAIPSNTRLSNQISEITFREFDAWGRFQQPDGVTQLDDRLAPLKTAMMTAPTGVDTPPGTVGTLDGGLLMPQQWQQWTMMTFPNGDEDWSANTPFNIYGQSGLYPPTRNGPYGTPATPFSTAYKLWCGRPRECPFGTHSSGSCRGLSSCACVHGSCLPSGDCLCFQGWGGYRCDQRQPLSLNMTNATTCPDPAVFDPCSGRGLCVKHPLGTGITCQCKPGWFGGSYRDSLAFSEAEMVQLYGSNYYCTRPTDTTWSDDGTMQNYIATHQCTLYDGEYQPSNWKLDVNHPTIPVAPYECATGYGGFWCGKCPPCVAEHTRSCGDLDPTLAAMATTPQAPRCLCRTGYTGALCDRRECPSAPGQWAHNRSMCGEDRNRGTCYAPATIGLVSLLADNAPWVPFNDSYSGRCVCQDGWGGAAGDCSIELCPHDPAHSGKTCGAYGSCVLSSCPIGQLNGSSTVLQESCVQSCVFDLLHARSTHSNRFPLCVTTPTRECCVRHYCHAINYTYTKVFACSRGSCVCETGFGKDAHGLCNVPLCPTGPNGKECSGYVDRVTQVNVCDRSPGASSCECWRAWDTNSGSIANASFNGPRLACENSYASVCQGPGQNAPCGGKGRCRPPQCEFGWRTCLHRNDRPVCECSEGFTGQFCEHSVCGGAHADHPCSAFNNGVNDTGVCNIHTGECVCTTLNGVNFIGKNCETPVQGCSGSNGLICSGQGKCNVVNASGEFACSCFHDRTGPTCNLVDTCPDSCPLAKGHCMNGTCSCFSNYEGVNCSTDVCAASGGTQVTPTFCACPAQTATLYPHPLFDITPPRSNLRGCRRRCPRGMKLYTDQWTIFGNVECGALAIPPTISLQANNTRYNRCTLDTVIAASAVGTPTCNCSAFQSINPITGTLMTFKSDNNGSCMPKCMHCTQRPDGSCNNIDGCGHEMNGICQWGGDACDVRRCTSHGPDAHWNGTACVCDPIWLYTINGTMSPNCSQTVCNATLPGSDPISHQMHTCHCVYPYHVDTNPLSPTFRTCVSACGPNGILINGSHPCVCHMPYGGAYCNISLCHPQIGTVDAFAPDCNCSLPQFNGPLCQDNACVGGTQRAIPLAGCDCYSPWQGILCNESSCSGHGRPSGTGASSFCICDAGWFGTHCQSNRCGTANGLIPVPCGTGLTPCLTPGVHDYNCNCGQVATFSAATGKCVLVRPCSVKGGWIGINHNNTLVCHCHKGFNGTWCEDDICGNQGLGCNSRQQITILPNWSKNVTHINSSHVIPATHQIATCRAPYYNWNSGCTYINCSMMAHPLESLSNTTGPGAVFTQITPTECGCSAPGYRPERFNAVSHRLLVPGEETMYSFVNSSTGLHPTWFVCVRDCDIMHTLHSPLGETCVCAVDWTGDRCDVFSPRTFSTILPPVEATGGDNAPLVVWLSIAGGSLVVGIVGFLGYQHMGTQTVDWWKRTIGNRMPGMHTQQNGVVDPHQERETLIRRSAMTNPPTHIDHVAQYNM